MTRTVAWTSAGTRNVLKAAEKAKVPRLVHMSSEAVLVKSDTPIVDADESTPVPDDPGFYAPYSKSKAMAERLVLVRQNLGIEFRDEEGNGLIHCIRCAYIAVPGTSGGCPVCLTLDMPACNAIARLMLVVACTHRYWPMLSTT